MYRCLGIITCKVRASVDSCKTTYILLFIFDMFFFNYIVWSDNTRDIYSSTKHQYLNGCSENLYSQFLESILQVMHIAYCSACK